MGDLLRDGAVLIVKPVGGWTFRGFSGEVKVEGSGKAFSARGGPVVLPEDVLKALAKELAGKNYVAPPFADVPGVVTVAVAQVDPSSVSGSIRVGGSPVCLDESNGTVLLTCTPALSTSQGPSPVPDPAPAKSATWSVRSTGQKGVRGSPLAGGT